MKIEQMAEQVVEAARGFVQRALVGVNAKLADLEARLAAVPAGPQGEKGERGERGEPGPTGAQGPAGERGADGAVGAQGERGERGEPGPTGAQGPAGERGADGAVGAQGEPGVRGEVGPQGPQGVAGPAGADGVRGEMGPPGPARDGRDGQQGVPGRDGAPGADGRDGFGLEDFQMELGEDGRTLSLRFARGDVVVERQVKLPTMLYREVWRDGEYEPGDVVTWGGSAWHCQQQTTAQPGNGSPDWRLMVKKGAPGKDGGAAPAAAAPIVRVK